MEKTREKHLLDMYAQEYEKHRDEVQNRITIQNQMADRAINITVMLVSLLAVLFTFLLRDVGESSVEERVNLFISVCVPVLLIHGVLTQLTLAAWIYQLSMMFRIVRYWNWIVETKIEPMIGANGEAYLWDRQPEAPWDMSVDTKVVCYFQPLFIYGLCLLMLLTLPLVWRLCAEENGLRFVCVLGFVGPVVLIVSLVLLAIVHLKVVRGTEAYRKSLHECKQEEENRKLNKEV